MNLDLIERLVRHIAEEYEDGAILVFLPGMAEISALCAALAAPGGAPLWPVPVHSTLTPDEQRLAFAPPPAGSRKVVVATNIAETAVTIEDCVFVIDSGRVRETRYDPATRMAGLVTTWVSEAPLP